MRNLALLGLGTGFILMGLALLGLTYRKAKPLPANPTKGQQREQAALADENKKMRIAGACIAAFGFVLLLLALL